VCKINQKMTGKIAFNQASGDLQIRQLRVKKVIEELDEWQDKANP